jgi:mannose-1-phosphate guanylyltransferase
MYAAILAGGVGSRLWPRSRQDHPKQFADITGAGRTMVQDTARRLEGLIPPTKQYVITGSQYAALAHAQLPDVPKDQILLEPFGRNTAPAIGLACIHLHRRDPNAVMAILSADHAILDTSRFQLALRAAAVAAECGYIVTLGIEPTHPHTGYGYIQRAQPLDDLPDAQHAVYTVEQFLEKPDLSTAQAFLASGEYYWNAGMFVARVDCMLEEIRRQLPALHALLIQIARDLEDNALPLVKRWEQFEEIWRTVPDISIDYGIMQGASKIAVVPLAAGWNDVGSWDALDNVIPEDANRNRIAKGEVLAINSSGNIVYSQKQIVALIDVDNLVVVDTGDTLLIGHKQHMQKVKDVVERLRSQGRTDLL